MRDETEGGKRGGRKMVRQGRRREDSNNSNITFVKSSEASCTYLTLGSIIILFKNPIKLIRCTLRKICLK